MTSLESRVDANGGSRRANQSDLASLSTATEVQMPKKARKSNRGARRKPPTIKTGTPKARIAQGEWDEFAADLAAEFRRRANHQGSTPYDEADSYLKREVYSFVLRYMLKKRMTQLESLIEEARFPYKPNKLTFKENPFHWVLFGVRDTKEDWPKKWQVSRFGRQLLYAHRHEIDPDLLIGFLYQSGTPDEVYEKAGNPNRIEEWFARVRAMKADNQPRPPS